MDKFTVLFYNVENLFDTQDNPQTNDDNFLPHGENRWDEERYFDKLDAIAKVIGAVHSKLPLFIGLAEIENRKVLENLVLNRQISPANYQIIHRQSPDSRGIDVAFLFQKDAFLTFEENFITITFPFEKNYRTREILHVRGVLPNREIVHFFVNHWPSRGEGEFETAPRRMYVASVLRQHVDIVFEQEPKAKILIMGDFNDEPDSASLQLLANGLATSTQKLTNLSLALQQAKKGTVTRAGQWSLFDQFLASNAMLHAQGFRVYPHNANIFSPEWLLFKHPHYGTFQPNRNFSGPRYHAGFSDHLPVYVQIEKSGF